MASSISIPSTDSLTDDPTWLDLLFSFETLEAACYRLVAQSSAVCVCVCVCVSNLLRSANSSGLFSDMGSAKFLGTRVPTML